MTGQKPPENEGKSPTYSAPALEKGLDVVELLAREPAGLSIGEMAARLGRSISELFRIIVVLDRRGWLQKIPGGDRYRVTYKVLEVAHHATPARELTHVAAPLMHDLATTVQQSCHLVVLNGQHGVVVLRQESPGPTAFAVRLGTTVDLLTSCSGHVLLAFATPEQRAALSAALSAPAELEGELETIRDRGYERLASARLSAVCDVSCPIYGFDGKVVAALTVPYLEAIHREGQADLDASLEALRKTAAAISTALGWYDRSDQPIMPTLSVATPPPRRRRAP